MNTCVCVYIVFAVMSSVQITLYSFVYGIIIVHLFCDEAHYPKTSIEKGLLVSHLCGTDYQFWEHWLALH